MTRIRRSLLKDTVPVETYSGQGAYGPVYAGSVAVRCNVDDTRRLVRDASGVEVLSEATLYVRPEDAALFTPESRLTIAGRASRVITVSPQVVRGYVSWLKVTCA